MSMSIRGRMGAVGTAALLLAGLGIAGASPAAAETINGTVDASSTDFTSSGVPIDGCDWDIGTFEVRGSTFTVTPTASGTATLRLTTDPWDDISAVAVFQGSYAEANCIASSSAIPPALSVAVTAGEQYVVMVWGCNGNCDPISDSYGSYTLELTLPGGPGADLTPWLQAYERAGETATCKTGWSPSWQEWAQQGKGGWVCTRTVLRYAPPVD